MKYISKILLLSSLMITALWSCKKDENQIFFAGGTAPVLKSSVASATVMPLDVANKDATAFVLSWTNPNYSFTTGVSSQSVDYTIEIDTTGANFTSPSKKQITLSSDLSKTITVGDLNGYLLELGLKTDVSHNIEIRLKSSLAGTGVLYSNVMKYVVTPYLVVKIALPASGKLFLVGNASPGGWNNPVPVPSQEFTRVSTTVFELTIALTGGNSYLLLPVNGDWSDKYGGVGANNTNNPDKDDFKRGGGDLKAPAASGNYKISVDFVTGKYTLTKL